MRLALAQIAKKLLLVITMPNADTMGSVYRKEIAKLKEECSDSVLCIENFGKENYFSAMYYSKVLIGNTSSGIIEAASFGKYVVNVGDRQNGRLQSSNVFEAKFKESEIVESVNQALKVGEFNGENIYCKQNTVNIILKVIKQFNATV